MTTTHRIEGPMRETGETFDAFRIYQNNDGAGRIGRLVAKVYAVSGIDIARREAAIMCAALAGAAYSAFSAENQQVLAESHGKSFDMVAAELEEAADAAFHTRRQN